MLEILVLARHSLSAPPPQKPSPAVPSILVLSISWSSQDPQLILSLLYMSPRKTLPEKPFSLGIFVGIYFTNSSLCLLQSPFAAINDYPANFLVRPAFLQFLRDFPASTQKWNQRTGINTCTLFCQNIKVEKALVDPFHTP